MRLLRDESAVGLSIICGKNVGRIFEKADGKRYFCPFKKRVRIDCGRHD